MCAKVLKVIAECADLSAEALKAVTELLADSVVMEFVTWSRQMGWRRRTGGLCRPKEPYVWWGRRGVGPPGGQWSGRRLRPDLKARGGSGSAGIAMGPSLKTLSSSA